MGYRGSASRSLAPKRLGRREPMCRIWCRGDISLLGKFYRSGHQQAPASVSTATAPIDRSIMKSNLDDFSHAWRKRINTWKVEVAGHTEKSAAQQLWSDLFRCFGIIPERIDLFERDAVRATTGNTGYIDLFWSGVVLGEAKSLGRDLEKAHQQHPTLQQHRG